MRKFFLTKRFGQRQRHCVGGNKVYWRSDGNQFHNHHQIPGVPLLWHSLSGSEQSRLFRRGMSPWVDYVHICKT